MASTRGTLLGLCSAAVVFAQAPLPSANLQVTAIAVDSAAPAPNVYMSLGRGLLRSNDSGLNFRPVQIRPAGEVQPTIYDIVTQKDNPQIAYVATDLEDGGVWRSSDGGTTWKIVNTGLPQTNKSVVALFQFPNTPLTLYAAIGSQLYETVYKSVDGGDTWTLRGALPPLVTAFTISPAESGSLYCVQGNGFPYISVDDGATWTIARNGAPVGNAQVNSIVADPRDPAVLYLAANGNGITGVFRSSDRAQSFSLVEITRGLQPVLLTFDSSGTILYSTSRENGRIYRSPLPTRFWQRITVADGAGFVRLAPDPKNPDNLWAGTRNGPYFSSNARSDTTANNFGVTFLARAGQTRPTLLLPAPSLDFNLPAGQSGRLELPVKLAESDQWNLPVSISTSNDRWISSSTTSTATPSSFQVRVNTQGLNPGSYAATVRLTSTQSANEVQFPVRLQVTAPEASAYTITSFAGSGQPVIFGDNGPARAAGFGNPDSVALDGKGNLFLSDSRNNQVRRIDPAGIISRWAGNGLSRSEGDGGPAISASFQSPRGLAVDSADRLYVADFGGKRVRRITPDGTLSNFATLGEEVTGVGTDADGNLYGATPGLHSITRITQNGQSSSFAGSRTSGSRGDGLEARLAQLSGPNDAVADRSGNIFIADTENHRIRKVTPDGKIRTAAGTGLPGFQGDSTDATKVALNRPSGLGVDTDGNVWIADTDNQRIRVLTPQGAIRTVAGNGVAGYAGDNGPALTAQLRGPTDVAVDSDGNAYVADNLNFRIRKLALPARPQIASDIVNAADGTPRLAPGGLFRITGRNFAASTASINEAPWPTSLGEVTVTFGDRAAPLMQVSATQITGQIPYEIPPGSVVVRIRAKDQTSGDVAVTIQAAAPAILATAAGQALILNDDDSPNAPAMPAAPGSTIRVMFTGQGALDNPVATGQAAPADNSSTPLSGPVTASVAGGDCEVVSVRMAPGSVGIAEVRLRLPADSPGGQQAMIIRVGTAESGAAQISVRESGN